MIEKNWFAREYLEGDESQVFELQRTVMADIVEEELPDGILNRDHWNWERKDNPAGLANTRLAISNNGQVVGHVAVLPVIIQVNQEMLRGGHCVGAVTHRDFRRQGIFTMLAKAALHKAVIEGAVVSYAFPYSSIPLFEKKLNWFKVGGIPFLVKPLNTPAIVSGLVKNRLLARGVSALAKPLLSFYSHIPSHPSEKEISINLVTSFDDRIDTFWGKVKRDYDIIVVRDKKYLNWRYVHNPMRKYQIMLAEGNGEVLGFIVLRCMELFGLKVGFIVDILTLASQRKASDYLIAEGIRHFQSQKMDLVGCLMLKNNLYYRSLKRSGFIVVPPRLCRKPIVLFIYVHSYKASREYLASLNNWFITWGDTELV